MYKLSRYWNRLAYSIIHLGRRMVWDQTGKNQEILKENEFAHRDTEDIMCDRK